MYHHKLLSLAAVFAGFILVSSASAQNVTVISGNGQVLGGSNFLLQPLVVQVTDPQTGAPVGAGVTVNWQGSGFNGFFLASGTNQVTLGTDTNGRSTAYYSLPATTFTSSILNPFIQNTVTASAGNTATFTITQLAQAAGGVGITPFVEVIPDNIPNGSTLSGPLGTTAAPPITFRVGATNGQSNSTLANVAVQLLNFQDPAKGPLVSCLSDPSSGAGQNTVLSDQNGIVTCTPVFSGQPGKGLFIVAVGGIPSATPDPAGFWQPLLDPNDTSNFSGVQAAWASFAPGIKISVTAGAAGIIKFSSPSTGSVTANAGSQVPISVEVDNSSGSGVSGSAVNWKVVSPASGVNLSSSSSSSDSNGHAFNAVNIGNLVSGPVQISATLVSDATKSVTITINVAALVTITQFQIVSGNNQTAVVNSGFGQPLAVKLTTSVGVGANIPVSFAVASGSISLSTTTVNTDSNGLAQVSVTAGSVTGPASVVASVASNTGSGNVTFNLSVVPITPVITAGNFVNGADLQANSLSPCGIGALVTNAGTLGISALSPTFPGAPVPTNAVRITFANIGAPILNIGNNPSGQQQILFQVPCELAPGSPVPVTLTVGGATSNVNVNVQAASPGIFQTQSSDGAFRAVLVRPDGSFVSLTNPARLGETEVAYVTGLGPTTPGVSTGSLPAPGGSATVQGKVIPGMSGNGALLISARLSEDLPGIYLVTFQIPSDAPTGNDTTFSIGVTPPGSTTTYFSGLSKVPVHQ